MGSVITEVQKVAHQINESRRKVDQIASLRNLQRSLKGLTEAGIDLVKPHRRLVTKAELIKKTHGLIASEHKRTVFLFNDIVLWTTKGGKYRGHVYVTTSTVVTPYVNKKKHQVGIEIVDSQKTLTLVCDSDAQQTFWLSSVGAVLENIEEVLQEALLTSRQELSRHTLERIRSEDDLRYALAPAVEYAADSDDEYADEGDGGRKPHGTPEVGSDGTALDSISFNNDGRVDNNGPIASTSILTQEEEEDDLPPGWYASTDASSGEVYYYNSFSNESTWRRPSPEEAIASPNDNTLKSFLQKALGNRPSIESLLHHNIIKAEPDSPAKLRWIQKRLETQLHSRCSRSTLVHQNIIRDPSTPMRIRRNSVIIRDFLSHRPSPEHLVSKHIVPEGIFPLDTIPEANGEGEEEERDEGTVTGKSHLDVTKELKELNRARLEDAVRVRKSAEAFIQSTMQLVDAAVARQNEDRAALRLLLQKALDAC